MACTSTPAARAARPASRGRTLFIRFLAAHDQHAIARRHLACHLLPQCFRIELRGSRRRRIHEGGARHRPRPAHRRSRFRRPGTGMVRPTGGRGPVREEMAHRVAADEHHGAIAIELAPHGLQRLRLRDRRRWRSAGSATGSKPRSAQVLDPSRGLGLRTGHQHLHGGRFSGRRRRAAARRRVPQFAGLLKVGRDGGPLRPHQGGRSVRIAPGGAQLQVFAVENVACAASGIEQLPPIARLTARSAATHSQVAWCASGASNSSTSRGRHAPRCPARPGPRPAASRSGSNTWRMRSAQTQAA